jgi:periplasmic divalent cation tolerance protein
VETGCVIVWTTIAATADGGHLASVLVGERLAACVNVLGEMESFYRWKGNVERDKERQMIIKTTADRVDSLRARLRELHTYEVPEFIVLAIGDGSENYLNWIRESVAG